jgi:multiple sugar transport system permease protein
VLHPARWVGIQNYHWLTSPTDDWPIVSKSIYNVAYLALVSIPLTMAVGLAIAMLLNAKVKGMNWYRTVYYLPSIVPVVAGAVLWIWILNPEYGLINAAWRSTLGAWFGVEAPKWLTSEIWSKPALILLSLWGAGSGMILWLAGLQGVPQALYEAAQLDGANAWQQFRNVTLPMISPYIFFNLIIGTIGVLQMFDQVYIMTGDPYGGPADSTMVPVPLLFKNGFQYFKMGYASALAWMLFGIILILSLIQLRLSNRWVHYEAEKGK